MCTSEDENDALVRVSLEQVLGDDSVDHHLQADPLRRVYDIDERIEVVLLNLLGSRDPFPRREGRIAEAWSVHHGQIAGDLALVRG